MSKRVCDFPETGDWPSISLEGGADESPCNPESLHISESGVCFEARWQFPMGTVLSVRMDADGEKKGATTGIVVESSRVRTGWYRTSVFFLEPTDMSPQLLAPLSRR